MLCSGYGRARSERTGWDRDTFQCSVIAETHSPDGEIEELATALSVDGERRETKPGSVGYVKFPLATRCFREPASFFFLRSRKAPEWGKPHPSLHVSNLASYRADPSFTF